MSMGPVASQGVEIQAIRTFGGDRTNIVYYSDVRISDRYRLGGVNDGWSVLRGPLDEEHGVGRDGASGRLGDLSIGSSSCRPWDVPSTARSPGRGRRPALTAA